MKKERNWKSPTKIYLFWILLYILFLIFGIPLYNLGHSDGEQRPLRLLAFSLYFFYYGIVLISFCFIPIYFNSWFKKKWFIVAIVGLIFIWLIVEGGYFPKRL